MPKYRLVVDAYTANDAVESFKNNPFVEEIHIFNLKK